VQEIERKFLVKETPAALEQYPRRVIDQGYLAIDERGVEVRLRRSNDDFYLTVKRKHGMEREEHEIALPEKQWSELWPLTAGRRVRKVRVNIPHGLLTIELDLFQGANEGFVTAEVEFASRDAAGEFAPPAWFGREITGDPEFSNSRRAG
jgi:adenylate cyclase